MKEGTIGDEIEAGRLMGKTYLGRFFPEMADPEESAALKKWIDEHPDQSEVYARVDDPTLIKNALEQYKRSTKMAHDAFRELEPRLGVKFSPPIRSIYYYLA
ncbi:MAG TPA: hypothetical protein VMH27_11540, partial [Puia sp.]|nr:hypothetical protein [Puia sp.]